MLMKTLLLNGALMASLGSSFDAGAQRAPTPTELPPVVVTATRIDSRAADVPASISRIDGSEVRNGHARNSGGRGRADRERHRGSRRC